MNNKSGLLGGHKNDPIRYKLLITSFSATKHVTACYQPGQATSRARPNVEVCWSVLSTSHLAVLHVGARILQSGRGKSLQKSAPICGRGEGRGGGYQQINILSQHTVLYMEMRGIYIKLNRLYMPLWDWNCAASFPIPTFMYLWAIYTYLLEFIGISNTI